LTRALSKPEHHPQLTLLPGSNLNSLPSILVTPNTCWLDIKQTRTLFSTYSAATVKSEFTLLDTGYSEYLLVCWRCSKSIPLPDKAEVVAILEIRKAKVSAIVLALLETFLELELMVVNWKGDHDEVRRLASILVISPASRVDQGMFSLSEAYSKYCSVKRIVRSCWKKGA
jgi:hypothetical protein